MSWRCSSTTRRPPTWSSSARSEAATKSGLPSYSAKARVSRSSRSSPVVPRPKASEWVTPARSSRAIAARRRARKKHSKPRAWRWRRRRTISWVCCADHGSTDLDHQAASRSTDPRSLHIRRPCLVVGLHARVLGIARCAFHAPTVSVLLRHGTSVPLLWWNPLICLHVGGRHLRCGPALSPRTGAVRRYHPRNRWACRRACHGSNLVATADVAPLAPAERVWRQRAPHQLGAEGFRPRELRSGGSGRMSGRPFVVSGWQR